MVSTAERKLIVRLRQQNKTVSDITNITGFKRSTVGFWIKRYIDTSSLIDLPRSGKPSNFSPEKFRNIKATITKQLVKKNNKFSSCTTKELHKIICKEIKTKISIRHTRRILHKLGLNLVTPRNKHVKNNPEIVKQFREEFKKNFKMSFWIIQ